MEFYEKNSKLFSSTRYNIWNSVKEFNKIIEKSYILDAGCGNGKNIEYLNKFNHNSIGIDTSTNLLKICKIKNLNVINSNILNLPFKDNTFDNIICIAVIHHLKTNEDRIIAIKELIRVLKKKGKLLITVWALEQENDSKRKFKLGDNNVKFNNENRYYHIFNEETFYDLTKDFNVFKLYWEKSNWNVILYK